MQHNHILTFIDTTSVKVFNEDFPTVTVLQLNQYPSKKAAFKDFLDELIDESWPDDETTPEGLAEFIEDYIQVDLNDLEEPFKGSIDLQEELIDYVKSGEYKPFEQ